jgi:hypothetical protein
MREVATRALAAGIAAFLVLTQSGCESGGGSGGVTSASPVEAAVTSVAGTWRGGNGQVSLVWRLSQDGENVNGASRVESNDGWEGTDGRVVGTIEGSTLSFSETHAPGSLTVKGCSVQLEGSLHLDVVSLPVVPPGAYYPGGRPVTSLPTVAHSRMSGHVRGQVCGASYAGFVSLIKD